MESADGLKLIIEIAVPKFMDTGSLNVDLHPDFVRCTIKDKVTQLLIPEEILVEKSQVQRSTTTGALVITCQKANADEIAARQKRYDLMKEEALKRKQAKELDKPIKEIVKEVKPDQTLKQWES